MTPFQPMAVARDGAAWVVHGKTLTCHALSDLASRWTWTTEAHALWLLVLRYLLLDQDLIPTRDGQPIAGIPPSQFMLSDMPTQIESASLQCKRAAALKEAGVSAPKATPEVIDQAFKDIGNDFDNLVIVAPPKALGVLRKALHKEVERRIVLTLNKEMTDRPIPDIEELLAGEAAPPA